MNTELHFQKDITYQIASKYDNTVNFLFCWLWYAKLPAWLRIAFLLNTRYPKVPNFNSLSTK